ncbi:unnamed protein product [Caenorhabditis bovis]|uniref:Cytochrome P450 n=1 Tax=Caenorhabditis bovis TaxID=2654633 RepID=A0A8S1F0X8_9PELO|nr:unnamed protein product [Caenorhabditis bovis]
MIFLLLFAGLISIAFYNFYWKRRNLPPGPLPLPLIGNLYLMTDDVKPGYKLWESLAKQYGPVYTFWIAKLPAVHVTDWELIRQHFIKDGSKYIGRPEFPMSIIMRKGPYGIVESYGDRWVQQRRFALHVLREFGLGKNLMETRVITEVDILLKELKRECNDGPIDMKNRFDASVGSIINHLLFGYRYDETNMDEFLRLKHGLKRHFDEAAKPIAGLIAMNPWLGQLPFFNNYYNTFMNNWNDLQSMFRRQYMEKIKAVDYDSDEYSDYVEAFLKERKKHEDEPNFGGFE